MTAPNDQVYKMAKVSYYVLKIWLTGILPSIVLLAILLLLSHAEFDRAFSFDAVSALAASIVYGIIILCAVLILRAFGASPIGVKTLLTSLTVFVCWVPLLWIRELPVDFIVPPMSIWETIGIWGYVCFNCFGIWFYRFDPLPPRAAEAEIQA